MAVDVFRERVDHDVGAVLQRTLQGRRREGRIHHDLDPRLAGDVRQRPDVEHLAGRVDGGLEIDEAGPGRQRPAQVRRVRQVDPDGLEPEPGQALVDQRRGVRVERVVDDDLVAMAEHRQEQGTDRRHARARHDAGFGAFEVGDAAFQQVLGGVVLAPVEEVVALLRDDGLGGGDVGEGEGRRHVDRRRHGAALPERIVAVVDGPGLEAERAVGPVRRHGASPERAGAGTPARAGMASSSAGRSRPPWTAEASSSSSISHRP